MKVIKFPAAGGHLDGQLAGAGVDAGVAIDAALDGESAGAAGATLRALREDVRSLAVPIDVAFERELQARVAEWGAERRTRRQSLNQSVSRLRRWITGSASHALGAAGAVAGVAALIVALAIGGSSGRGISSTRSGSAVNKVNASLLPLAKHVAEANGGAVPLASQPAKRAAEAAPHNGPLDLGEPTSESSALPAAAASGHLQQLGASVSLATKPSEVQAVADSVTRLGVNDGGYVQSSHVQVRQGGASEATLMLSIPSAKLSQAIAALGRIASLRAVNQESQDITAPFDAARRRLGDDEAVRRALLRALAAAATQGQIDSLREQLNGNRSAISRDRAAVRSVSSRAANSQLEVTIAGAQSAAGDAHEGLTLNRGLRVAGHVLTAAGAVLLIALAVIVPLALIALVLAMLRRVWLRRSREAALGS